MPCRVGGAFPSLPTRRISSSGTVIHESGPDKRTLGVLRPALPLNHLPTARRAAQAYVQRGAPRARQDLRLTWPVILLRDSRRPPASCGDSRPILVRDLRGMERSRRSLCQTHLLICRALRERRDSKPATSGVTGRVRHNDAQRRANLNNLICRPVLR